MSENIEEDVETVTVEMKARACHDCQHIAVVLGGRGSPCINCEDGEYGPHVKVVETTTSRDALDGIQEHSADEIHHVHD